MSVVKFVYIIITTAAIAVAVSHVQIHGHFHNDVYSTQLGVQVEVKGKY